MTRIGSPRAKFAVGAAFASITFAGAAPVALAAEAAEPVSERVSFADLDLRQLGDQQTLKVRVRTVVRRMCFKMDDSRRPGLPGESTCVGETMRRAKPQLIAAIRDAQSGERLASAVVITRLTGLR